MKKVILLFVVLLSGCVTIEHEVPKCGGFGNKHLLMEVSPHVPVKNGELIFFFCMRKDVYGNAVCNYKDTFFLKSDHRLPK